MALFDSGTPSSLADVLGNQANNAVAQKQDQYAQARKRKVAQLAHSGQLMGGTADYHLADLAEEGAGAESDIYSGLASALGAYPAEDMLNENDYQRNLSLAKLIGKMNERRSGGALGGTMGGLQGALSGGTMGAQIGGPWGALIGGGLGGGFGAYGGMQ